MTRPRLAIVQSICPHYRVPLFQELARRYELVLFHGRGRRAGAKRNAERITGFAAHRLATIRVGLRTLHPYLEVSWLPALFFHLVRWKPDVIVTEGLTSFPNALAALLYGRLHGVPVLVWDGGRRPDRPMPAVRRVLEPLNRALLCGADGCIAYSTLAARSLASAGVHPDRIVVAPNTIDIAAALSDRERRLAEPQTLAADRRELAGESVLVLYVGALERRKRLERLMGAVARQRERGRDVRLALVGDGPHRAELERLAAALGGSWIHFAGRVTDGVGRYFASAEVFVLPGPGGLSLHHAMAYGLPVVVWGGDGTEEDLVLDGETGYLVNSPAELEDRLGRLVDDRELRERMGRAALARIPRFDLAALAERFAAAIDLALARPRVITV